MLTMPDHRDNTITRFGLTEIGAGTAGPMYMYKRQVTGNAQDRVIHILKVTGRQRLVENHGQEVTGRRMHNSIITDRIMTGRITDIIMTGRIITGKQIPNILSDSDNFRL